MTKSGAPATSLPTSNYVNQICILVKGVGNINQQKEISRIMVRECEVPSSVEYKDVDETSFLEPFCQLPSCSKDIRKTLRAVLPRQQEIFRRFFEDVQKASFLQI